MTGRLSKLEYLDLGGCEQVSFLSVIFYLNLIHLATSLFEQRFFFQVQDTGLVHLLNLSGPNLKILGLESTGVTGEGLSALAEPLAKLESLDLDVCEQLTGMEYDVFFSKDKKIETEICIFSASRVS